MTTSTARLIGLLIIAGLLVTAAGRALAAAADDGILPLDQYTSDKARRLATTHAKALGDLSAGVYHCLPWLEVQRQSIGFFRPKGATQDDRYLSMRVYIEQDPSSQFAHLAIEERASAMFSRYVGPLLRRMTANPALMNDPALDGFSIILEWLKQMPRSSGDRPVHETIAIFMPKPAVSEYLRGRVPVGHFADSSRVLAWDGETALGPVKLTAWDDNFVSTYKVANYQVAKGVTCR
jgi:hypothetical protein